MAPSIGLLQGPVGVRFLTSELPLYISYPRGIPVHEMGGQTNASRASAASNPMSTCRRVWRLP